MVAEGGPTATRAKAAKHHRCRDRTGSLKTAWAPPTPPTQPPQRVASAVSALLCSLPLCVEGAVARHVAPGAVYAMNVEEEEAETERGAPGRYMGGT